jgi:hypothetical protein
MKSARRILLFSVITVIAVHSLLHFYLTRP